MASRQNRSAKLDQPAAVAAEDQWPDRTPLMKVPDAARYLNMSPRQLYRLMAERRIPFVRAGGRAVRFRPAELDAWLDAQQVTAS